MCVVGKREKEKEKEINENVKRKGEKERETEMIEKDRNKERHKDRKTESDGRSGTSKPCYRGLPTSFSIDTKEARTKRNSFKAVIDRWPLTPKKLKPREIVSRQSLIGGR